MPAPNELPEAVRVLIAYAERRIRHTNTGRCPDGIEGHRSRTKGCPVCDAIVGTRTLATYVDLLRAAGDGREDTKRMDWLEQRGGWQFYRTEYDDPARKWFDSETIGSDYSPTLRAAIDAAMGAGQEGKGDSGCAAGND